MQNQLRKTVAAMVLMTAVATSSGLSDAEFALISKKLIYDLTLPSSTVTVQEEAFQNTAATAVYLPDGVMEIKDYAFADCHNLQTVRIPSSVRLFGAGIFDACSSSLTIIGSTGSPAQKYASDNHIQFIAEDAEIETPEDPFDR